MVRVQINSFPVTIELEGEETVQDLIGSVSQWARERDLIFLETQIGDNNYPVDQIPDMSLHDVESINCVVRSRAEVIISSLGEGIAYCDRVMQFFEENRQQGGESLPAESLAVGIDWLSDILHSVLGLLQIDGEMRYRDRRIADYLDELAELGKLIRSADDASYNKVISAGDIFESVKNIFRMILQGEDLGNIVMNSIDSPDTLIRSLNEIRDSTPEQIQNLEEIAIAFQTGRDAEGSEKLQLFIDFMYFSIRTFFQIIPVFGIDLSTIVVNGDTLEERNVQINDRLQELVTVMENNDIISLTDILEYEIKPLIENLDGYIEQIEKQLAGEE